MENRNFQKNEIKKTKKSSREIKNKKNVLVFFRKKRALAKPLEWGQK